MATISPLAESLRSAGPFLFPVVKNFVVPADATNVAAEAARMSSRGFALGMFGDKMVPSSVWLTGAPLMWAQGFTGDGVTVGVIDSGVDNQHPDLTGNVVERYDYVDGGGTTRTPFNEHGTHVAGTIAANGKMLGVAPAAKVVDYRVLGTDGSGSYVSIANAIRHAAEHCDIINMSLGGDQDSPAMRAAVQYAVARDVLVVVASGNKAPRNTRTSERDVQWSYPAGYPEVVGVGCVDLAPSARVARAWFSNYNKELDVCADGFELLSTSLGGGYVAMSGTSMAAPVVSGFAALLLCKARRQRTVKISEPTMYSMLKTSTIPLTGGSEDGVPSEWLYGVGLVSAYPTLPTFDKSINRWVFPEVVKGAPSL